MSKGRYSRLLRYIFEDHFEEGMTQVPFVREELLAAAEALGFEPIKNLGDAIYSLRYRQQLPEEIRKTAPLGMEWIIRGSGAGAYAFELVREWRIEANPELESLPIPDATPGLIEIYRLTDEQALLAMVRYNRLVDIFSGLACYSLQSHLRTQVDGFGQVETDEVYVGLDGAGSHFVLPLQAKAGNDRLGRVQIEQDLAMCQEKFPTLECRPLAAQFLSGGAVALFEFIIGMSGDLEVRQERHYQLVSTD